MRKGLTREEVKKRDRKYMVVAIVLIFIILIFFAAALSGGSENTSQDPNDHTGAYNYDLYEVGSFSSTLGFVQTPDEGMKFVAASIIVSNNNYHSTISNHQSNFKLQIGDVKYAPDLDTLIHPAYKEFVEISKGNMASSMLLFVVPENSDIHNAELKWTGSAPRDMVVDASLTVPEIDAGNAPGEGFGSYNYKLYKSNGFVDGYYNYSPGSGNMCVVASITLINNSYSDKLSTNPYYFNLRINNVEYDIISATFHFPGHKDTVGLTPGGQYSFVAVYEVPSQDLAGAEIIWDSYPSQVYRDESLSVPNISV